MVVSSHRFDIYKLYKLVFNDIYLCKKIYKFVRGINRQFTNSMIENKSFTQRCRYNEATFIWMVKNAHFQLLKDKIKIGKQFKEENDDFTLPNISLFLTLTSTSSTSSTSPTPTPTPTSTPSLIITKEILNTFYETNKKLIKELASIDGILKFAVDSQNLDFIEIIYQQEFINKEFKLEKTNNPFNFLMDSAIKNGNLEIIKFVHNTLGIEFVDREKTINNIIASTTTINNKNKIIKYLLNEINFKPIKSERDDNYPYDPKSLFTDFFNLESSLFKKLFEIGLISIPTNNNNNNNNNNNDNNNNFIINKSSHDLIISKLCTRIRLYSKYLINYNNGKDFIPFNNVLNFFQNTILFLSTIKSKYCQPLKNINKLLQQQDQQQEEDQQNEKYEQQAEFKITNLFSNIKSVISNKVKSIVEINSDDDDEINFSGNKIEIQLKRIILIDFLKEIKELIFSQDEWTLIILNYSRESQEYNLIQDELNIKKIEDINVKLKSPEKMFSSLVIQIAVQHGDPNFIEVIPTFYEQYFQRYLDESYVRHHNDTSTNNYYYNPKLVNINQQLIFIETIYKYNFQCKEIILKNIFDNFIDLTIVDHANKIIEIIKNYNSTTSTTTTSSSTTTKLTANLFTGNEMIFKYYFKNHYELFDWNDKNISESIIKSSNLELIEFIHNNEIGSLDLNSSINHCKTRQVAELMYEKLGYKFDSQLIDISNLNDWNSNYLFYYAINKIIKDNQSDSSSNLLIITSNKVGNDYKKLKFLSKLIIDGKLNFNNISIGDNQVNEFLNSLNSLESLKKFGNLSYINQYIKENNSKIIFDDNFCKSFPVNNNFIINYFNIKTSRL
ncbi:hypothetical protein DDB_G0283477 [Dictyostelium discoideum AX4]|uniref:Ankyrin repeat-containing protein n=1 Tax=Dictyostelium discoideum TaxID=44689 RepID=Q54QZ1_DICDI|nr:hypothetical protein DDB_G0283477 [Dictyostelium discoideum AX4]EAL65723.1 hypothetical protein DDB_G0283477 [Dictyostelium discoideum AX4]|eukprot:XP_639100.1 hypothetical protein DDB_G0283477 [Dictyostelium discoideum AX4]